MSHTGWIEDGLWSGRWLRTALKDIRHQTCAHSMFGLFEPTSTTTGHHAHYTTLWPPSHHHDPSCIHLCSSWNQKKKKSKQAKRSRSTKWIQIGQNLERQRHNLKEKTKQTNACRISLQRRASMPTSRILRCPGSRGNAMLKNWWKKCFVSTCEQQVRKRRTYSYKGIQTSNTSTRRTAQQ